MSTIGIAFIHIYRYQMVIILFYFYLLKLHEEKICAIEEKLELSEQKLAQQAKLQPDMEEQLKARMEALTKVGNKVCAIGLLTNVM